MFRVESVITNNSNGDFLCNLSANVVNRHFLCDFSIIQCHDGHEILRDDAYGYSTDTVKYHEIIKQKSENENI